ncbi:MAG: CDGSH iron-sulfur domain-containing protein [Methanomethylovorans sp.]|jgi:CDGSH-type Zn-finger protein|nr:CDGSH iron-sulfur domain-containing protein [Methanomethylovorans sp.]
MSHAEKTVSHKKPLIEITKNGPYIVKNIEYLISAEGTALPIQPVMALCRCGGSSNKPFCDGTHNMINFEDSTT